MSNDQHTVVLVYSTSHAIRAEKILVKAGISCKLIPVPRHISSDCGVCVRVSQEDKESTIRALQEAGVDFEGIHDT